MALVFYFIGNYAETGKALAARDPFASFVSKVCSG